MKLNLGSKSFQFLQWSEVKIARITCETVFCTKIKKYYLFIATFFIFLNIVSLIYSCYLNFCKFSISSLSYFHTLSKPQHFINLY